MAARIRANLPTGGLRKRGRFGRLVEAVVRRYHGLAFYFRDVRPAIIARRKKRGDDVISHLLDEGYPDQAILIECVSCDRS